MATKQVQVTDRILVYDVHTTISDNYLRKELLKTYKGVQHVKRLYHTDADGFETPKELIQVEFTSAKYAETFVQEGFINIDNLRCRVKGLRPSMRVRNQLESDNGSDYQSDIFTEEQQITDKILIHDVPTTIAENDLALELSKTYRGIKHVKRWYSINESQTPTERVQVDFQTSKDTESILQDGFIDIGQLCCSVTPLKPSKRLQRELGSDYGSDYQSEIFIEDERVNDKILVYNVPITIDVNVLQQELLKTYPGIKQISRWCFDEDCQFPMVCVQIDFISSKYTEAILQDGFIVNGTFFYKVKAL
jgi:hypothetical protein